MSADDDPGVVSAAHKLRAVRAGLSTDAEPVDDSIKTAIDAIVELIERPTTPELRQVLHETAHEIRLLGTQMTAIREDATDAIGHALATEASQIEALLGPPDDGDAGGDVVSPTPAADHNGPPELAVEAPADMATAPPPKAALDLISTAVDAQRVAQQLPDAQAVRRAINQTVAQFPPKLQELARVLLRGASSHAIQRHGHHLTREHLLARLQWLLDPAGVDTWQLNPDGSTESHRRKDDKPHQVGTTAGHYTSPQAAAKPLTALLKAAGRTQAELDTYLDTKANGKTIVRLFLRPADTGIDPHDVSCLRAPGTDTRPGKRMWISARNSANAGHGEAPAAREYDLVTDGSRPGSLMIFTCGPRQDWRLITSYFHDGHDNELDYTEL